MSEETDGQLEFKDEGFGDQIISDVSFNTDNLDAAMIEQAGLYAFYAHQSYLATKRADNLKLKISIVEGAVDKEIRDDAVANGLKVTEKGILAEISRDSSYVRACMAHNDARAMAQMIKDMLEAFKHRKDMLIQIGVSKREEFKGQTRVATSEKSSLSMEERREKFKSKAA